MTVADARRRAVELLRAVREGRRRQHDSPKTSSRLPMMLPVIDALTTAVWCAAQRGDRDDQLGGVAERGVEEAAERRARAARQMFGGRADQARRRHQRDRRGREDPDGHAVCHRSHRLTGAASRSRFSQLPVTIRRS